MACEIEALLELSIVIVNWNTRALLLACLKAIEQNPPARTFDIWVVENGSTDGSADAVRAEFPAVHLIANAKNAGFAAANNQALTQCAGRYILLLNSDTEAQSDVLEALCAYLDAHPRCGAAGCRLLNPDGTTQRSAWRGFPGLRSAALDGLYLWKLLPPRFVAAREVSLAGHTGPQAADHLLGACLLTRREVVQQVGLLDDGYFLFLEETDWCRRIGRAGWGIAYLPEFAILHHGQQSMRQIPAQTLPLYYSSLCRFVRKSGAKRAARLRMGALKVVIAVSVLLRLGLWTLRLPRSRSLSLRMLRGYANVLRRLPSF